jgi:hypothetical protein
MQCCGVRAASRYKAGSEDSGSDLYVQCGIFLMTQNELFSQKAIKFCLTFFRVSKSEPNQKFYPEPFRIKMMRLCMVHTKEQILG